MTADTFKEILNRRPFQPFRVVMSSGESYVVPHPEIVAITRSCLFIGLPDPSHPGGERFVFCSYLHIAHVEIVSQKGKRKAG